MIPDFSKTTRQHIANQLAPTYALNRRRCAGGKASTVRQLGQYGSCLAFVMARP